MVYSVPSKSMDMGDVDTQPTTSVHLALHCHYEWSNAHAFNRPDRDLRQQQPPPSWSKSPSGFLKININTAINKFANSLHFEGYPKPREAEAVGLLHGLIWSHQFGRQQIVF